MSEFEIQTVLNNSLIQQSLFMFAFLFSAWFSGRAAVVSNESGNANIISKIVITAFALSSIFYINLQVCYIDLHVNNYGHSLAVLKESGVDISARAEAAIEFFGSSASEVPMLGFIPESPIAIIFILSITLILLSGIWVSGNKE